MHFIRLIRPINLLIIGFTMYSTRMFLYVYEQLFQVKSVVKEGEKFDFFLLVLSTVMIAAAGNIINDYFDVKADRINKPEKLIITKYVDRKLAILSHWILNFVAFSIAIYLSARNNTFWYVFIHLLSINSLWFYSMYFKRRPLIGNIIIAGLTALVPILCGVHFFVQNTFPSVTIGNVNSNFEMWIFRLNEGHFILVLAFFAFLTNVSREMIKDIEDIEGDKKINAKTFAIQYGIQKSKFIASLFLAISPIFFSFIFFSQFNFNLNKIGQNVIFFVPVIFAILTLAFCIPILLKAKNRKEFSLVDSLIKMAMFMGIVQPFYWLLFL